MPKNLKVIDWKPSIDIVVDWKPKNEAIVDSKPKMGIIKKELTDQLYNVTLAAGMPIGLLLSLTYKNTVVVQNPISR